MSLSPDEIEHKNFVVALRGYDKNQVDEFLKAVADEYREVVRAKERALKSAGEGPFDPFEQLGEQVAAIARAAADGANQILAEAERSRSALLESARREAAMIREQAVQELEAARAQRDQVIREASEVRASAEQEAARVKAAAEEQVVEAARLREQAKADSDVVVYLLEAAWAEVAAAEELRVAAEEEAQQTVAGATEEARQGLEVVQHDVEALDNTRGSNLVQDRTL